ncbi:conserved oligomeric Golgi complex subunit 3, partial [Elysia marginata]
MVHVCEDEYQLFFNFFAKPTPLLDEMLERICTTLYDVFRPLIIHINHLETLSELCSILKGEMMEEHVKQNRLEEPGSNMPMSPADLHGMWYPTVRRALVTLSKLYRCID